MKLHALAALTVEQRKEVKRLHEEEAVSIRDLAERFRVNKSTVERWVKRDSPLDRSSAHLTSHTTISPGYRQAVVAYREGHPKHGPIRIARELRAEFPQAHRGTVLKILQEKELTRPRPREQKPRTPIPVGRHRVQMDVQQLPAVAGGKGFEFKVSIIHLRTRLKYSEICSDHRSETVAGVLKRALDVLPPLFSSGLTTGWSSP